MSLQKFLKFRDERDTPKPFLEHVEDLRGMVVRMAIALGLCMILAFVFRGQLASFVQAPLLAVDPGRVDNLQSLGVADSMPGWSFPFRSCSIFSRSSSSRP